MTRSLRARAWLALAGASVSASVSAGCPTPGRDVVAESRDVRGPSPDTAASAPKDDYVYVVRRPHGDVGLVGAHFMTDVDAKRIVERIADELETCARRAQERGELASGAIQLVAVTGSRGTAEVTDMKLAPGGPVAANALECIVAPLRVITFPKATNAGAPALAIEATWGPARAADGGLATDAGQPR